MTTSSTPNTKSSKPSAQDAPSDTTSHRIKKWSFSGLQTYERCPLAAKKQYIDRLPRKESPKADRGNEVHKDIEDFVSHEAEELTFDITKRHIETFTAFREDFPDGDVLVEAPWGFDANWNPCDFDHADVWTRGLLDLHKIVARSPAGDVTHVHGFDWKTGKRYPPKHLQQEQLYVVFTFRKYPMLETFDFSFVYLDEKGSWAEITTFRRYDRARAQKLEENFTRRGLRMTLDITHKPNPNIVNCKYCDFNESCEWAVK